jgi:hypothetical protein
MVQREMTPIKVYVEKGLIFLEQPCFGQEDALVTLHLSQVPLLIRWLKECASEAESQG